MRHLVLAIVVALLLVGNVLVGNTIAAGPGSHAYVSSGGVSNMHQVDLVTNGVSTIPVGALTHGVAVDPQEQGTRIYTASMNGTPGSLYAIENQAVATSIAIGRSPFGVAVSADGRRVYVTHGGNTTRPLGYLAAVDVAATGTLTIGAQIFLNGATTGVATSGNRVYVANTLGWISVINAADLKATPITVSVGSSLVGLAVSSDGSRLYAVDSGGKKLWVLDPALIGSATSPVLGAVNVGTAPFGVAVSPDGRRVFVANSGSDNVSVVDPALLGTDLNPVVAAPLVGDGPHGIAVTSDGSRVYVVNRWSHNMSVLGRMGEPLGTIPLSTDPNARIFPVGFGNFLRANLVTRVEIDIRPASINTKAQGTVPVILFGSATFYVDKVDVATVKLGGASVAVRGNGPMAQYGDWGKGDEPPDGIVDVMLHFESEDIQAGAVRAMDSGNSGLALEGQTFDGTSFEGTDAVRVK